MVKWLVRIDLMDHCYRPNGDPGDVVPCRVYGLLMEDTKTYYRIMPWVADNNTESDDSDSYIVVKHKGIKLHKIRRETV
jgi:hypothetical protein